MTIDEIKQKYLGDDAFTKAANAMARLMNELVMARSATRSEYDTLAKETYNLSCELDNIASNFKKGK